jgi:hypothetical protein
MILVIRFSINIYSFMTRHNVLNDQVKENEMGRACSTNMSEEDCI